MRGVSYSECQLQRHLTSLARKALLHLSFHHLSDPGTNSWQGTDCKQAYARVSILTRSQDSDLLGSFFDPKIDDLQALRRQTRSAAQREGERAKQLTCFVMLLKRKTGVGQDLTQSSRSCSVRVSMSARLMVISGMYWKLTVATGIHFAWSCAAHQHKPLKFTNGNTLKSHT